MILSGKLSGNAVIVDKKGIDELYKKSYYGRVKGDNLEISLAEVAYLIYSGKLRIEHEGVELDFDQFFIKATLLIKNFELLYIVYKDLKERGYYVQPSVTGFRVYPRGGHPGKTPAEFFIYVTSERIPLPLADLRKNLETAENVKKRLVLAIVDEESDITYYEVKKTALSGSYRPDLDRSMSVASLLEDRVMVWEPGVSKKLQNNGFFGKPIDEDHLQLSLVESFYLLNEGILEIEKRNRTLDPDEFSGLASEIESDFMIKYKVYETMRNNGIVPKTGFKFGTHFRVYKDFKTLSGLAHSDYLVHALENNHVFSLQQLSRAVRLANSVRKEIVFAVVDTGIMFFIIGRIKL